MPTSAGDAYTLVRGCYDEQYAAGMRRLGGAGTGAGQDAVSLAWKVCMITILIWTSITRI